MPMRPFSALPSTLPNAPFERPRFSVWLPPTWCAAPLANLHGWFLSWNSIPGVHGSRHQGDQVLAEAVHVLCVTDSLLASNVA